MPKKSVMTLSALVSAALIACAFADAQKAQQAPQKINLAPTPQSDGRTGGSAADLLNVTKFNPESGPSKSAIQLTVGCTDAQGNSLKPEDTGYNQCLADAQKAPATGAPTKPTVGFTIGK